MNPIAWLISLVLPACGFPAAQGLPTPQFLDVTHIVRPATPNTALAAPPQFNPTPDIVAARYQVAPPKLFAAVQKTAFEQPRTYQSAIFPDRWQVHYVVRSAIFNFPDLVTIQIEQASADSSYLIMYSRSVYGRSDLGVNRKRVETWLAALQQNIP